MVKFASFRNTLDHDEVTSLRSKNILKWCPDYTWDVILTDEVKEGIVKALGDYLETLGGDGDGSDEDDASTGTEIETTSSR